jgi:hypothetical protein
MSGKSEERKISESQLAAQKEMAEAQLAQQLAQLRGQQLGQEEALQRAQQAQSMGESAFQQMTSGTPEAITRLQGLIRERALPEQQQALSRTKLAQQQAGVRGPEAALMAQQQATRMGTDLARAAEEVALKQALEDRSRQAGYAERKALAGLGQALTPIQKVVGESPLEAKQKKRIEELEKQNTLQAQLAAIRQSNPFQKQQTGF